MLTFEQGLIVAWVLCCAVVVGGLTAMFFHGEFLDRPEDAEPDGVVPDTIRLQHHAIPWRREVAAWLLRGAAEVLANTATISKGLPA